MCGAEAAVFIKALYRAPFSSSNHSAFLFCSLLCFHLKNISVFYTKSCSFPVRRMRCCQKLSLFPLSTPKYFIFAACWCYSAWGKKSQVCIRLWVKWHAGLSHLWRSKVNKHILERLRPQGQEDFLLEMEKGDGISLSSAPPFFNPYMATVMCSGLLRWFTSLFSEGIILARGEMGVGWPTLLAFSPMKYFFVCLFPVFPPHHESADSLFVLIYAV